MAKKKSPRRNAAQRAGGKAAGDRSSDKGSPALAPVHNDADHDDGDPDMPADVQEQREEGAAGAHPSEDVTRGRTLSPAETARSPPSEPEEDAAADVPAWHANAEKAGKRNAEKGAKSDAAGAGRMKPEVSPDAEMVGDRPSVGEKVGGTVPTVKKRGAAKDEGWAAEDATAEELKQVERAPENELLDHIKHHEAPTFADLAKNLAAADAEENAIEAAAAAEEVPKPVDRPPDSELAELIKHHEAPSFSAVAKHLAEIDAEEKAIDDAAAAKEVPEPGHHSRDSGLVEHIKNHEAPTFVDVAKHAAQKEEVESKPTDEPDLKPEAFPTIAEAGGARAAEHIAPQEMGGEDAENLVQKIAHDRAPSFAEIAKQPPHEVRPVEENELVQTTKEEDWEAGPVRLRGPDEASDRDEESGDVFLSAMELEQQQGQQHQQEPAPVAAEERTVMIVNATTTGADAAASPAKSAVQRKASAAGAPAHEEKEIFVAEPCRPTGGSDTGTSHREAAKKKKVARISLFVGAGALAAAAIAILGLTTRYRLRKGPAASLGTVVGAVVGLFGWMYARGRS